MQLEEIGNENNLLVHLKVKGKFTVLDFDTVRFKIHTAVLHDFPLEIGSKYTKLEILKILELEENYLVKEYMISLINKKLLAVSDVIIKTNKKFHNPQCLNSIIKELKNDNLLNDNFYVKNYLIYFDTNNYGKYYIFNYFLNKKVLKSIINDISFPDGREEEKAFLYFESIKNKYVSNNYVKQKKLIYDVMLKRGFGVDIILKVLGSLHIDKEKEMEQLSKDFKKLYLKYKEKYSSNVLFDKVVTKLVSKGYNYYEINEIIHKEKEND